MEQVNQGDAKNGKKPEVKDIEEEVDDGSHELGNLFEEDKEVDVIPEFGNCGGDGDEE